MALNKQNYVDMRRKKERNLNALEKEHHEKVLYDNAHLFIKN